MKLPRSPIPVAPLHYSTLLEPLQHQEGNRVPKGDPLGVMVPLVSTVRIPTILLGNSPSPLAPMFPYPLGEKWEEVTLLQENKMTSQLLCSILEKHLIAKHPSSFLTHSVRNPASP